jgi:hypothetical protein
MGRGNAQDWLMIVVWNIARPRDDADQPLTARKPLARCYFTIGILMPWRLAAAMASS